MGGAEVLPPTEPGIYDRIVLVFSFDRLLSIVKFRLNCVVEIFGSLNFCQETQLLP